MEKSLFEHLSYKAYLKSVLASQPSGGHGFRSKMAMALGCQVSYISQVLNKGAHLSPEQAEALNAMLGHSEDEAEFFLLLVQIERAGTPALRKRLQGQIQSVQKKRLVLKNRVDIQTSLPLEEQAIYYSSWHYAVIHILVTIKAFQTRAAIHEHLKIPAERINEVLNFLIAANLVKSEKGRLLPGVSRIFLGTDSPLLNKHHTNWRMRAIESLDQPAPDDIHFSGVVSLAKADVLLIKEKLLKDLNSTRAQIKVSEPEEEIHALCLDFFKI